MLVRQISIFIEDKLGRIAHITESLGESDINIRGFSIADSAEGYGIFHLITSDNEKAEEVLRECGFSISSNDVICVEVPDRPGGLAAVLKIFSKAGLNVEYLYSIVHNLIVFKLNDNHGGVRALQAAGIRTLSENDIRQL